MAAEVGGRGAQPRAQRAGVHARGAAPSGGREELGPGGGGGVQGGGRYQGLSVGVCGRREDVVVGPLLKTKGTQRS